MGGIYQYKSLFQIFMKHIHLIIQLLALSLCILLWFFNFFHKLRNYILLDFFYVIQHLILRFPSHSDSYLSSSPLNLLK